MIDKGTYKISIQNMPKLGWKSRYFKSTDVQMLVHGCGISQYPQVDEKIKEKHQMLPRTYVGSYSGKKGHQFLQ